MSDRLLVTGGLGFVGSALVARLLGSGYDVTVFDDISRGSRQNIDDTQAKVVVGDIRDLQAVSECLTSQPFDAVIHLAAMHFIPDCNRDPQGCIVTNVVGTENLLAACADAGVTKVIAASSMAVYPIMDDAAKETDPVGPYDIYGETKATNEWQLARWSRSEAGRIAVAIRLSNAYGPRETNPHVIPEIIEQLRSGVAALRLGNVRPLRDYVHVDDVATGIESLVASPIGAGFHVFNLGSGEERSVADVIDDLSEILGMSIATQVDPDRVRPVERMHLLPDIGKLATATGWTPAVDFKSGIAELCRWYGLDPRHSAEAASA